jgi:uncharacterized protein YndB with AHSA1/START domain
MKTTLQFDFIVDKDKNTITVKKEFAANRQLVWDCHTKSNLLDQWFAPKPFTAKTKSMDFREGGHWLYAMVDPEGKEFLARMDYQKINPISSYTLLDSFCDDKGNVNPDLPRANWSTTFTAKSGDSTLVETVVTYKSLAELETVIQMGMKEGLIMCLEGLDELIAELTK